MLKLSLVIAAWVVAIPTSMALAELPDYFDWRDVDGENYMTPVKDQALCGSCWAHSAVGTVEAQYNIYLDSPEYDTDLSEEYLVSDCFESWQPSDCFGGWPDDALNFIDSNGIPDEACFPYVDANCRHGCCRTTCPCEHADQLGHYCSDAECSDKCADWEDRLWGIDGKQKVETIDDIKNYIYYVGPLSVCYRTTSGDFDQDGIWRCTGSEVPGHCVVMTGYNATDQYWICKNSEGGDYGPDGTGYFKIGFGECHIEDYAYGVILSDPGFPPFPPSAHDSSVVTKDDTIVEIALKAGDEGLPDPPGALSCIITSLPSQGMLSDPGGGAISSVPYTLAENGNHVIYQPPTGYSGTDSFKFKANDGGTAPDGGYSDEATINVNVFEIVNWWKLDEGSGQIAEDSVGDSNGILGNSENADAQDPAWVTGKRDGGLDFDGEDDYVDIGTLDALKGETVTISAWIKADDASAGYDPLITQYHIVGDNCYGYNLCLISGKPCFCLDDTIAGGDAIDSNEWHHLAGTYDGVELRIYLDGDLKGNMSYADGNGSDTNAYLGGGDYEGCYFDGIIDDVRVYNWAVDVDEIWDNMYYGTSKFAILNDVGVRKAWFDDLGNLFLKGGLAKRSTLTADDRYDEFRVQDSAGNEVAIIDVTNGNMYITGDVQTAWSDPDEGEDEFIIHNDQGSPMAYINESGNLYLKGKLYQNANP